MRHKVECIRHIHLADSKIIIFPMFLDAAPNMMNNLFRPSRASDSILKMSEKILSFGLGDDTKTLPC